MKRIWMPLLFVMTSSAWAGDLKLTLHGKGVSGKKLYVAVHSVADNFPSRNDKAIKSTTVVAQAETTEVVIPNIPPGEYAIAAFADMNGNGGLDSNFIGIPREPVGFSRDAKIKFGPPKFADAAFKVGDGVTVLTIELK